MSLACRMSGEVQQPGHGQCAAIGHGGVLGEVPMGQVEVRNPFLMNLGVFCIAPPAIRQFTVLVHCHVAQENQFVQEFQAAWCGGTGPIDDGFHLDWEQTRAAPCPDMVCPGQYGRATLQQRYDLDTVLADHAVTDAHCQCVLNICRAVHNTLPQLGEAVLVKQTRQGCQTPGVDSGSRDRGGLHLKRLVVFVMVVMYQKRRPVPLYSVLTAQSLGAVQQFGEQAEIDEIAIQTAPCGNGVAGVRVHSCGFVSTVTGVSIIGCFVSYCYPTNQRIHSYRLF